jgi:hypothetical protein
MLDARFWRLRLRASRRVVTWAGCGIALVCAAPFACSATGEDSSFEPSSGSGGSGAGDSGTGTGGIQLDGGPGSGGGGNTGPGCSEEAKLVYVVGQGNELYKFDPPSLAFTQVGIIDCPQNGGFATPFSMAVARNGSALVLFSDGKLYRVDTTNAACTATTYQPGQATLLTFGMGYVSDAPGSEAETLYVGDYEGKGIGKIDTDTMTMTFIGPYDTLSGPAEMTGTGDARLFGFFLSNPVNVAEIDKTSGDILSQAPQPTVTIGSAWAFAFWGGDFWLFTNPSNFSSQVDRYQPSTGMTTTVKQNVGISIVGAGVSTCAPVEPPS